MKFCVYKNESYEGFLDERGEEMKICWCKMEIRMFFKF